MISIKAVVAACAARLFVDSNFKALRTGLTLAVGGEFGIALLTLLLQNRAIDPAIARPMLVAVVVAMVLSPLILSNNKRIARLLLGESGPPPRTANPACAHVATGPGLSASGTGVLRVVSGS